MAWRRSGNKPLSEPPMVYRTDAYMLHSASMSLLIVPRQMQNNLLNFSSVNDNICQHILCIYRNGIHVCFCYRRVNYNSRRLKPGKRRTDIMEDDEDTTPLDTPTNAQRKPIVQPIAIPERVPVAANAAPVKVEPTPPPVVMETVIQNSPSPSPTPATGGCPIERLDNLIKGTPPTQRTISASSDGTAPQPSISNDVNEISIKGELGLEMKGIQ